MERYRQFSVVEISMARTLVVIVLVIATAYADDGCVGWDDMVEDMLFAPLKDLIVKGSAEFQPIPNLDQHFGWGTHVKISNGSVGNLTSFDIVHLTGRPSASYMCQNDGNITVAMDLSVNDLEFQFENFMAKIPVLPEIGDTKATFKNTGNKISVSVTLMTDDQSNCVAHLNYLQFQDFGTTTFNFENGKMNKVYQWIMSHGFQPLTKTLKYFNLLKSMENSLEQVASALITQQGQQVCNIFNGGGL